MTSPSREAFEAWADARDATHAGKLRIEDRGFDYPLGRVLDECWQAAIQHARDVAVKACEEQADHKEQAKADAASRAAKDDASQLMRLQHWSTVSTYNAGIRRCADAIKEALK